MWQSHGVFVIKPKKHARVERDCVLAWAFTRDGFLFLRAVMLLHTETAPESSSAESLEVGLVLTYPDSTRDLNLTLLNLCPFQFP